MVPFLALCVHYKYDIHVKILYVIYLYSQVIHFISHFKPVCLFIIERKSNLSFIFIYLYLFNKKKQNTFRKYTMRYHIRTNTLTYDITYICTLYRFLKRTYLPLYHIIISLYKPLLFALAKKYVKNSRTYIKKKIKKGSINKKNLG